MILQRFYTIHTILCNCCVIGFRASMHDSPWFCEVLYDFLWFRNGFVRFIMASPTFAWFWTIPPDSQRFCEVLMVLYDSLCFRNDSAWFTRFSMIMASLGSGRFHLNLSDSVKFNMVLYDSTMVFVWFTQFCVNMASHDCAILGSSTWFCEVLHGSI